MMQHIRHSSGKTADSDEKNRDFANNRQTLSRTSSTFDTKPAKACACGGVCPKCREQALWVQPKLKVGPANDEYEQEADRIAEQVMRADAASVQTHTRPLNPASPAALEEEEEETLQTKSEAAARSEITPALAHGINSLGSGRPLEPGTRDFFESRFKRDFSNVRIHTDSQAAYTARAIGAHAYTRASDIVFAAGQYAPDTVAGRKLLAHELTHVVQQQRATGTNVLRRYVYGKDNPPDSNWHEMNDKEQERSEAGMEFVTDVSQNSSNKRHRACTDQFKSITNGGICPSASNQELIDRFNAAIIWGMGNGFLGQSIPKRDIAFARNTLFTPLQVAGTAIHEFGHCCGVGTSAAEEATLEKTVKICGFM